MRSAATQAFLAEAHAAWERSRFDDRPAANDALIPVGEATEIELVEWLDRDIAQWEAA